MSSLPSWSRAKALAYVAEPGTQIGKTWGEYPFADFFSDLPQLSAFGLPSIQTAESRVRLSSSEWDTARFFDDLHTTLRWHQVASAMLVRDRVVARAAHQHRGAYVDPGEMRAFMWSEIARYQLVDQHGTLDRETRGFISHRLAFHIAEAWITYGGPDLPPQVTSAVLTFSQLATDASNLSAENDYGRDGRPTRTHYGAMRAAMEMYIIRTVRELVTERLPFTPTSWDQLDLRALFSAAAYDVAHTNAELDRQNTLQAERRRLLELASADLPAWQDLHPAPPAAPYGVTPGGAEMWVRDWLLHMGASGANVTQLSGDGGIDILADLYIAQVKLYVGSVGIAEIREFLGVASLDAMRRVPLFFTSGKYPSSATQLANETGMALYYFEPRTGEVRGINSIAEDYGKYGFLGQAS